MNKVDVTPEIKKWATQDALTSAAPAAHCSISSVISTLYTFCDWYNCNLCCLFSQPTAATANEVNHGKPATALPVIASRSAFSAPR